MVASPGSGKTGGVSGQTRGKGKGSGDDEKSKKKRNAPPKANKPQYTERPEIANKPTPVGSKTPLLDPEGKKINLPEGVTAPQRFSIAREEPGQRNLVNREVSSQDYFNDKFASIEEGFKQRGKPPLTLEEKNDYIIKSLTINSSGVTGQFNPEYMLQRGFVPEGVPTFSEVQAGQTALDKGNKGNTGANVETAQQASQVGQLTPEAITSMTTEQIAELSPEEKQMALEVANANGIDLSRDISIGQALATGAAAAVPGAIGGALVAGPVGAAVGAIGTFVGGVVASLRTQAGKDIDIHKTDLNTARTNLKALITDNNTNPAHASENIQLFNHQLAIIDKAQAQLKLEARTNLNKFVGKSGKVELVQFELFNSPGGSRDLLIRQMQDSMLNPDPSKALITMEDIE